MKTGKSLILFLGVLAVSSLSACRQQTTRMLGQTDPDPTPAPRQSPKTPSPPLFLHEDNVLANFPTGAAQLTKLCSRPGNDKVRNLFCSGLPPTIGSLAELQKALGIGFEKPPYPQFAVTAHSSSVVEREVSAINPRAVIFTSATDDFVAMGYVRGGQAVEIAAGDPVKKDINLYLLVYSQACNANHSCAPGDLLTPKTERNWTGLSLYDDEDLKNTILDCRHCHQPAGPTTKKFLIMQEIIKPWTHWMQVSLDNGKATLADFQAAHGTKETYAGIPGALIEQSNPPGLGAMITSLNQQQFQNTAFDSQKINDEVKASSPRQPADNSVPGKSATWDVVFNNFVTGKTIQAPYHDEKITDPNKLQKMITAYANYRNGITPADQLVDIRDVLPDDPVRLSEMGLRAKPGLTAKQILINTCTQCHHSKLDQSLSRAKFDVSKIDVLTSQQKTTLINRLKAPADSIELMPPRRFRVLTAEEIQKVVDYLSR
jgi:hypothetical protein